MNDPLIFNGVDTWTGSNIWNNEDQSGFISSSLVSGSLQLDSVVFCEDQIWNGVDIWTGSNVWKNTDCQSVERSVPQLSLLSGTYNKRSKYGTAMFRLLPTGDGWPLESEDTILKQLLYGIGTSLQTAEKEIVRTLEDDIFPDSEGPFLTDWERIMELPKCGLSDLTIQQRVSTVKAMFNISPYSNAEFLEGIAAVFGYDVLITSGVELTGNRRNVFKIYVEVENPVDPIYFRAGISAAGDALVYYDFGPVECLLNFFKPAHSYLEFTFKYPDAEPEDSELSLGAELVSGVYTAS